MNPFGLYDICVFIFDSIHWQIKSTISNTCVIENSVLSKKYFQDPKSFRLFWFLALSIFLEMFI